MLFPAGYLPWQPRKCCLDAFVALVLTSHCPHYLHGDCLACLPLLFPCEHLERKPHCLHNERLTSLPLSNPQVKLLEVMEGMDKETFEFKFGKELTFTTVLSDQQVVELIPGGAGIVVGYEDRCRFIQLVQKTRLEESKEQVPPRGQ